MINFFDVILNRHLKQIVFLTLPIAFFYAQVLQSSELDIAQWPQVEKTAEKQDVYFHAWGGSQEINRYLQWAKEELDKRYKIRLHHVKVADISESVARMLAEKVAQKSTEGSVDLIWINGENFKSLKENKMLYGPFVNQLPNWQYVDKNLPVTLDFSVPTEGLEAPWGVGQLVFIYDAASKKQPPRNHQQLLNYLSKYPHRFTYPRPPEFHGTSFLKSLLIELTQNDPRLQQNVTEVDYRAITAPFWNYLDKLHPKMWREGKQFPTNVAQMLQLLDDGQIDLGLSFNPNFVYAAHALGTLADSTKAYAMDFGALSNIHYLAVPWNANAKAAALVTINFLLSPEAQSYKNDINIWGDPSVLKKEYLSEPAKKTNIFKSIQEPHPSWTTFIEQEWLQRYGK